MFIIDFLAFVAFNFWYNLIAIAVFGFLSAATWEVNQNVGGWLAMIAVVFGGIELWNILVWFHQMLHVASPALG